MSATANGFATANRPVWAMLEGPVDTDANYKTAFASQTSVWVDVCVGDVMLYSPLTGRVEQRNHAWNKAAMTAVPGRSYGDDGAEQAVAKLIGVTRILRDENKTPGLDPFNLSTICTYPGASGFFIYEDHMLAPQGSDYTYKVGRRVLNQVGRIAYSFFLPKLNGKVKVSKTTGYIDEDAATAIEKASDMELFQEVTNEGDATLCTTALSRTTNLLTTPNEPVTIDVELNGYFRNLSVSVGAFNPGLVPA